jgi:hypothetical protein
MLNFEISEFRNSSYTLQIKESNKIEIYQHKGKDSLEEREERVLLMIHGWLFFFEVLNVAFVEIISFEIEEEGRRSLLRKVVVVFSGEIIFVNV